MEENRADNSEFLRTLIPLIDHTSLSGSETEEDIAKLCAMARGDGHQPEAASVCVYPKWVRLARELLQGSSVKTACVVNFPEGQGAPRQVASETNVALAFGAQQIDLVTPWRKPQMQRDVWYAYLDQCADRDVVKMLILETGAWENQEALRASSDAALAAGFDFLKTSTGQLTRTDPSNGATIPGPGATPEAVSIMLDAINHCDDTGKGIKISGGVSSFEIAAAYLNQIHAAALPLDHQHVRLGSSGLLPALRTKLAAAPR